MSTGHFFILVEVPITPGWPSTFRVCGACDLRDPNNEFPQIYDPPDFDAVCPAKNPDACRSPSGLAARSYGPGAPCCELPRGHEGDHRLSWPWGGLMTWANYFPGMWRDAA